MTPGLDATAALAAALPDVNSLDYGADPSAYDYAGYAEAIIAALAAAGWRITSAPPAYTRLILASESLLDWFGTRTESGRRLTAVWGEQDPGGWYEPAFTESGTTEAERTDAAVRAALEGLRAELDALTSYGDSHGGSRLQARVLAIIDARLAALDE